MQTDLGAAVDLIVDGGVCTVGLESTIVACLDEEVALLRPGGVTREAVERVIGHPLAAAGETIRAPGQLASHYAPTASLRLDALALQHDEIGLAFGGNLPGATFDLSKSGDLAEAAANLYRDLRRLDAPGVATIAVGPIPDAHLGAAINDRLRRAAAPRC